MRLPKNFKESIIISLKEMIITSVKEVLSRTTERYVSKSYTKKGDNNLLIHGKSEKLKTEVTKMALPPGMSILWTYLHGAWVMLTLIGPP